MLGSARIVRHKIFIFFWISAIILSMIGLIVNPILQSASIPQLINYDDNKVFRFNGAINKPFLFKCTHNVSFILDGKPEGYGAKPSLNFRIKIRSSGASGVCRMNFTVFYNGVKVMCNVRDETFESGSEVDSVGRIVPPEWEVEIEGGKIEYKRRIDWRHCLKSGKNNVTIETIIYPLNGEFHFGDGEIYVEIGPMKVEVQSLDVDKDGIIDSVDTLEVNNYIMLPILGIFHIPLCAFLEYVVKKLHKKSF